MILCVADVKTPTILELTDGWYSIDAHCDPALQQLVSDGKVFVGLKLVIAGAELSSPGPTAPLEKGCDTFLKVSRTRLLIHTGYNELGFFQISANSTRRARWDSKLGVLRTHPAPFPIRLSSVKPDGGSISHLRVTITRVYPLIYMEKQSDGKKVFHSERHYRRMSESASVRYERLMEKMMEDLERQEEEQERKRMRRSSDGRLERPPNLTDEEKRLRIHAEAAKQLDAQKVQKPSP